RYLPVADRDAQLLLRDLSLEGEHVDDEVSLALGDLESQVVDVDRLPGLESSVERHPHFGATLGGEELINGLAEQIGFAASLQESAEAGVSHLQTKLRTAIDRDSA